ncbi:hypothetical protein RHMOL_Rhmol03G0127600 [Rhododendron molle]|uniref:Uncharacterized protein n=1 Tax=Rhododendron molle TaxID=49168 RepID=A0ACC0PEX1_RHOML|nr:hypothetical protein RHMOL_Rhmol03G0127600 [Rhododendron molle]
MADHGSGGGGGEVIDQPEDRGGPMEIQTGDQTTTEGAVGTSAAVTGGGDGGVNQQQEIGDEENPHTTEENPHATIPTGAAGFISEAEGPGVVAEGSSVVGGSSGDGGSSGAMSDISGPNGSPPRDSARGKGVVIAEAEKPTEEDRTTEAPSPVEIPEEDIAFRPLLTAATSSRLIPITFDDIAEHTPDEILARLLGSAPILASMF